MYTGPILYAEPVESVKLGNYVHVQLDHVYEDRKRLVAIEVTLRWEGNEKTVTLWEKED
jgi:hypothetical protein